MAECLPDMHRALGSILSRHDGTHLQSQHQGSRCRGIRFQGHCQVCSELEALLVHIRPSFKNINEAPLIWCRCLISCYLVRMSAFWFLLDLCSQKSVHVCSSYSLKTSRSPSTAYSGPPAEMTPCPLLLGVREISMSCAVWCGAFSAAAILQHLNKF